MLKIGLTGGIASGKSTICQLFSDRGINIIDADIIARQLVEPHQSCLTQIVQSFGTQILLDTGELDRSQLRRLVFADLKMKHQLEKILHPRIRQQLIIQSNAALSPYCMVCIPLLIESNMFELVDRVLVIETSVDTQLDRVCKRDNTSLQQAKKIIASQSTRHQRANIADDIINNNHSAENLNIIVKKLHEKYLDLANVP